jgi:thiamine biosynthesis lipoprotein
MGSEAHVVVVGGAGAPDALELVAYARRRIDELERRWSRFLPDSEVSSLNCARGVPRRVSPDTFELVRRAVAAWHDTDGRFDPTVLGDLVRAGYDRPFEAMVVRAGGGVSALRRDCGGIRLEPTRSSVTLPTHAGFDPGGIGKGLAADLVADELLAAGAAGVCVNIGGDLRVEGVGPDDGRWLVGVDGPPGPAAIAVVALAAGAVATSTTRKRAWSVGGEARHHLIDPATGRPSAGAVIVVTALARTAASAEVATKAALLAPVPGPAGALAALAELGCDGLVVTADDAVYRSVGLGRFLVEPAPESEGVA